MFEDVTIRVVHSSHFWLIFELIFESFLCIWQRNKQNGTKNGMWKMSTVNALERKTWKNEAKMHFSHQAQCQKGEKWSFLGSLFVQARLGFHFSKWTFPNLFFISFWVSISKKNGTKKESRMKWKMNEKWVKKANHERPY